MREIKFRGINPDSGAISDVDSINFSDVHGVFFYGYDGYCFKIEDCELMQFTGLKDQCGTEIYEGDIVECWTSSPLGEIEQQCILVASLEYGSLLALTASDNQPIIGNIHESPELIPDNYVPNQPKPRIN